MPPDIQAVDVSDSKTPKPLTPTKNKTLFHYFSSKVPSETTKKDELEKAKDNCEDEVKIKDLEQSGTVKKTSLGLSKKRKKARSDRDSEDENEDNSNKRKKLSRSRSKVEKRSNCPVRSVNKVDVESGESSEEDEKVTKILNNQSCKTIESDKLLGGDKNADVGAIPELKKGEIEKTGAINEAKSSSNLKSESNTKEGPKATKKKHKQYIIESDGSESENETSTKSDVDKNAVELSTQLVEKSDADETTVEETGRNLESKKGENKLATKKKKQIIESDESESEDEGANQSDDIKGMHKATSEVTQIVVEDTSEVFEAIDKKEEKLPSEGTTPKEKPRSAISNFFSKVTKEKRLMQSEKDASSVKVKAMIHVSPQSEDKKPKDSEEKSKVVNPTRRNKRKISNVSRSSTETDVIEVLEVAEEKTEANNDQDALVEVELESNLTADEACVKISSLLKTGKRGRSQIATDPVEKQPGVKTPTQSPVKKSSKLDLGQKCEAKSAFALLMSKDKGKGGSRDTKEVEDKQKIESEIKTSIVCEDVIINVEKDEKSEMSDEENECKEKEELLESPENAKLTRGKNAFTMLMKTTKDKKKDISEVEVKDNSEVKEENKENKKDLKSDDKVLTEENGKCEVTSGSTLVKPKFSDDGNAFSKLMKKCNDKKKDPSLLESNDKKKDTSLLESKHDEHPSEEQEAETKDNRPRRSRQRKSSGTIILEEESIDLKVLNEKMRKVLGLLQKKDVYDLFAEPVDTDEVPDYLDIVKNPMDFSTMRKKIDNLEYGTLDDLEKDFVQIIDNCHSYNEKNSDVYQAGVDLKDNGCQIFIKEKQKTKNRRPEASCLKSQNEEQREINCDKTIAKPNLPEMDNKNTSDVESDNEDNDSDDNIEVIELDEEQTIYEVTCKESKGEFHHDKFESGGKGRCILFQGNWLTPNEFEKAAGSRAKKYKASLYVNGKPIVKLIDPHGTRQATPTCRPGRSLSLSKRGSHRSGSETPGLSDLDETQEILGQVSKALTSKLARRKKKLYQDKENNGDAANLSNCDEDEDEENTSGRKRSGRIAKNKEFYDRKRKEQEEEDVLIERHLDGKERSKKKGKKKIEDDDDDDDSEIEELDLTPKKAKSKGKIASIFMVGKKSNPPEDPEKVAARKAFLMSAAPEVCRVQMEEYELQASLSALPFTFPTMSHVQQKGGESGWNLSNPVPPVPYRTEPWVSYRREVDDIKQTDELDLEQFTKACDRSSVWVPDLGRCVTKMSPIDVGRAVTREKVNNPKFPVNRVFRRYCERKLEAESFEIEARDKNIPLEEVESQRLRRKRRSKGRRSNELSMAIDDITCLKYSTDRSCGLQWTNKYQPRCAEDMVGNLGETRRLRGWLKDWSASDKRQRLSQADSDSDEDSDGSYECDMEEREGLGNTAVLTGPNGVGKTAAVYAVAVELGFKVFEVNASSARTGRQVLASLHEATQSQQVTQKDSGQKQTMQGMFDKKKEKPNKESKTTLKTALILLEDIDIVFDELDDGFYAAVNSLIQLTKRPIVMTTSDKSFLGPNGPGTKLFKNEPQKFYFVSVAPRLVTNYLNLMCLAEGHCIDKTRLMEMADKYNVSKCVLQLQFHAESTDSKADSSQSRPTLEQQDSGVVFDEDFEKSDRLKKKWVLVEGNKSESEVSESEASVTGDLEEDDDDVLKELLGTDRRKLGSGLLPSPCTAPVHYLDSFYCHLDWLRNLPLEKQAPVPTAKRYPLKKDSEQLKKYKKIDPLMNSSLFTADSEDEDEPSNTPTDPKEDVAADSKKNVEIPKTTEERDSFKRNKSALLALSQHMDVVSEFDTDVSERFWFKDDTTKDSLCQNFLAFPSCPGRSPDIVQTCLRLSGDAASSAVSQLGDMDPVPQCELNKKWKKHVKTSQQELLTFWPDPSMLTEDTVMEVFGALRGIARGEEERRVGTPQAGRRGGRFQHYFNSLDIHFKKSILNNLCNSLLDE